MLKIFGNVQTILGGKVTPSTLRPVEKGMFRFALGGATFSDAYGMGETLVIEGVPHISWVREGKLLSGKDLKAKSPFLMGVDPSQPTNLLLQQTTPIAVGSLYEQLALKYPMGFAIAGSFAMDQLAATYLKKAPIYEENINEHRENYWASVEHDAHAFIFLFGVVIPSTAKKKAMQDKWFERAFYNNPGETVKRPFDSHTHAALVDRFAGPSLRDLGSLKLMGGVRHVLTESMMQKGSFFLFPIHEVVTVK